MLTLKKCSSHPPEPSWVMTWHCSGPSHPLSWSEHGYMCACECVYVWGKWLLAFFPPSGLSATPVQITQVFVVASAVLLTAKNRSSLHPTSKYFLQYQAMVLTQLPLTDYWCVSSLRIWGRDKQWGYDHVCFQTGVFSFYSRVSMSGKCFFFSRAGICNVGFWMPSAFLILRIKPLHRFCTTSGKFHRNFLSNSTVKTTDL